MGSLRSKRLLRTAKVLADSRAEPGFCQLYAGDSVSIQDRQRGRGWHGVMAGLAVVAGIGVGVATAEPTSVEDVFPAMPSDAALELSILEREPTPGSSDLATTWGVADFAAKARVISSAIRDASLPGDAQVFAAPSDHGWMCVVLTHSALDMVPASSCRPTTN